MVYRRPKYRIFALLSVLVVLSGCGKTDTDTGVSDPPRFEDARLAAGRSTWMMTCRACHLTGVAGAPAVSDYDAWSPRLAKGRSALHQNALDGIASDSGWTMPPRGGNTRLSTDQVIAAVDYMLAAVTHEKEGVIIPE